MAAKALARVESASGGLACAVGGPRATTGTSRAPPTAIAAVVCPRRWPPRLGQSLPPFVGGTDRRADSRHFILTTSSARPGRAHERFNLSLRRNNRLTFSRADRSTCHAANFARCLEGCELASTMAV